RRLPSGLDAALEIFPLLGKRTVPSQPILRACELPGGFEIARIRLQTCRPDPGRLARARELAASAVERVRIGRAGDREKRDVPYAHERAHTATARGAGRES